MYCNFNFPNLLSKIIIKNLSLEIELKPILSNINLSISKGEKISIVGSSVSGKTTLAKLFVIFYDDFSGVINFNNVSIRNIEKSDLRKNIHYIPQQTYIFNGTILENLTFSIQGQLSKDETITSWKIAEIYQEIEDLPFTF